MSFPQEPGQQYEQPHGHPPHMQQPPPAPQGRKPKVLAILSLVLGILGILTVIVPWVAIGAGIVAVILGVIALILKHSKGLAIAGTIVGGVAVILGIGALVLFAFANAKLEELAAPIEPAPTQEPEGLSLFEEMRAEVDLDEFAEVDAATFAQIMEDPASHQNEGLIVYGNMGQPLVHDEMAAQGICLAQFVAYPTAEAALDEGADAIVLDETPDGIECAIAERFMGLSPDGTGLSEEAFQDVHRLYVVPGESVLTEDSGNLPAFVLLHAESPESGS